MEDYLELLEYAQKEASEGRSCAVFNKDYSHAALLIAALIKSSKTEIAILTGNLDKSVYCAPEVLAAILGFCKRGGTVRILLDGRVGDGQTALSAPYDSHPFIDAIKTNGTAPIVKYLPSEVVSAFPYHFQLFDKHAYRFESDCSKMEADADFNNKVIGDRISKQFDLLWSLGTE